MVSDRLHGTVALITGGSRGIGAAAAEAFAREGARVVITHRDSERGARETLAKLHGDGHRVIQVSATDTPGLERAAETVHRIEGRLDVLVNNAAKTRVIAHDDLVELDDAFFDEVMQTNVRGVFATIRAFRALLDADGGGVIVNVSSLAAQAGEGSNVAYAASKAALDNMTRSLARALAPSIRVVAVAPGLVETQLTREWAEDRRIRYAEQTPLGRLGTPEDIAQAIVAAGTRLNFTTGAVLPVDGGRPLNPHR